MEHTQHDDHPVIAIVLDAVDQDVVGAHDRLTGAGHGLALRMDNTTQYTADDFLNQVKFWGIAPSFAVVAGPQTNGVAERFNRTLKEQAIHGRIFRNVKEVRAAVTAFKDHVLRDIACHAFTPRRQDRQRKPDVSNRLCDNVLFASLCLLLTVA